MYKIILLFIIFFSMSYSQTSLNNILFESWSSSENDFLLKNKNEKYVKKEAMGYTGYLTSDTLNSIEVETTYFFDSNNKQVMRGIQNKNQSEAISKKFFNHILSSLNESIGISTNDSDMLGARIIKWKHKGYNIILIYKSDECILTITK